MANNEEKGFASTHINWARRNLAKLTSNPHKISIFTNRVFAYCEKRRRNNVYLDRISIRKR